MLGAQVGSACVDASIRTSENKGPQLPGVWLERHGGGAVLRDPVPEDSRAQEAIYQAENSAESREGQASQGGRAAP